MRGATTEAFCWLLPWHLSWPDWRNIFTEHLRSGLSQASRTKSRSKKLRQHLCHSGLFLDQRPLVLVEDDSHKVVTIEPERD